MNVCENVLFGAKLFPEQDAIVFEGERITYAQIERWSSQAAYILRQRGVQRGDRVGIVLPNVPAFVVWYFATLRLGAIAVSINTRLAAKECAFILDDCQAQTVVVAEKSAVAEINNELPGCVTHVLGVSESSHQCQGEALAASPYLEAPGWIDTEPDEPAVILYTSGTTGFPKGATLSHQNVRATVHAFNHLCEMRRDDRMLLAVPLFHCFGQNALLNSALNIGATLVMQRRFDLNESKRLITEQQVTKLFGVPTTFHLLWECCEPAELASIKYCFSAAATLPIQLSRKWQEKFGMPIYEGYGLTETAPFASYNHRSRYLVGSIGTPVDLVEMKIVDMDTGETCAPGELGEIAIRGPNVMLGYWNRPEETTAAIRGGWFHSGDIGRRDEQGYFYIVDRLKDMISVGGMKVFPAEVERVLLDHPAVAEAAVVGFPDAVFGEKVVAFIVAKEAAADTHQMQLHCKANLADYKVPKVIEVLEQLPRNPSGKVLKTRLRELELTQSGVAVAGTTVPDTSAGTTPGDAPLVARLRDTHPAGRERAIVGFIQDELKAMLEADKTFDPEERLLDTGLDSMMIVELSERLQREVGDQLELTATLVFDHPRIRDLATFLADSLDFNRQRGGKPGGGPTSKPSDWAGATHPTASVAEIAELPEATLVPADISAMSEQQALQELLREVDE